MKMYIYEHADYPDFSWDKREILNLLTEISQKQGKILGKMLQFGFGVRQEAMLNAMAEEIVKSSEIEGEILNSEQVRSSLASKLNIKLSKQTAVSHHIDGVVDMMLNAVNDYKSPLTKERLFGWHAALFPTGYSGMSKIKVAEFRKGEMLVVSTKHNVDIVHYKAPHPKNLNAQMQKFLKWFNSNENENPLLKAAIAHLWFVVIHPFEDGNGRIARAITDMQLARSENTELRFYSMARQIQKEKKDYYKVLDITTAGTLDITYFLKWFLDCLGRSIDSSGEIIGSVLKKAEFWKRNSAAIPNKTEREIMNLLLNGFKGNLTSSKIAGILKISQDTATRHLNSLAEKEFLQVQGKARATGYFLVEE